ncbi:radical SAM protein [uncultured Aquimarina sp.]|uniref:radical SAM/SPASM domain-containing protein n=1 Tax=uncultured Aquimarina sp. TaxID=575652 RepID=UPI0026062191|nr:radical SAM protein [uncultured Aquimarina sp.]
MIIEDKQTLAQAMAQIIAADSKPISPNAHFIRGAKSSQLFIPNGSRLFSINQTIEDSIQSLLELNDEQAITYRLAAMGISPTPYIDDVPLQDPPMHALSLAIAQKCNMGCTYCYAQQGDFGGPSKKMTIDTAKSAIDLLIDQRKPRERVQLTFLGGEPLMNRDDIQQATIYAVNKAKTKDVDIQFSITTNGTLVREEDAIFFEKYGFAVTVSLDGLKTDHDKLRLMKNGTGSYDKIMKKIEPLLRLQKKMQVSARVTVTSQNMNLGDTLDTFIEMGFHSVGFSPLLKSSDGEKEMSKENLENLLTGMIDCGLRFERAVLQGKRYPFLNMINALKEIDKETHRPYPCGAGAGYFGVSADGELSACHRFVNEPKGKMGTVEGGVDPVLQNTWLKERHVHNQSPCGQCWARYLCGGGCHHEVIDRGRTACDYIRGWLYFTIQSYERINRLVPDWNA